METLFHLTGKDTNNAPPSGILTLPNELLIQILSYLPSDQLVLLYTMCRRFHSLIPHIVHRKIEHALNPDNNYVELEFSVTSEKLYFQCGYLKTWRVDEPRRPHRNQQVTVNSNNIGIEASEPQQISNFGTPSIGALYSHFSLTRTDNLLYHIRIALSTELVSTWVSTDDNEPFAYLRATGFLIDAGPYMAVPNNVGLFDEKMLVEREWLRDAEKATSRYFSAENIDMRDTISNEESDSMYSRILWFGKRNVAGVKFRVRERKLKSEVAPVLMDAQYEPDAIYELYFEALLVRTMHVLMEWERNWGA